MAPTDKSHVEAWKALIDFAKTMVSLSVAILTALIGYYIVEKPVVTQSEMKYIPPVLIVLSIFVAIYGIGRAIRAVKSGESEKSGVLFSNISVILLIAGILTLPLLKANKRLTLDGVLLKIENESKTKPGLFSYSPTYVENVEVRGTKYFVSYKSGNATKKVTYSTEEGRIVAID